MNAAFTNLVRASVALALLAGVVACDSSSYNNSRVIPSTGGNPPPQGGGDPPPQGGGDPPPQGGGDPPPDPNTRSLDLAMSRLDVDPHGGISRSVVPVLFFTKDLDSATVSPATVTLRGPVGDEPIAVSVAGGALTVTPAHRLYPLGAYTLTVSSDVHASDGEALATPVSVPFTVADGVWQSADKVEDDDSGNTSEPQIVVGKNGNALAVWLQSDGLRDNLIARRYLAGQGWGEPTPLEQLQTSVVGPRIAIDGDGNALVVWQQRSGTDRIMASRYDAELDAWSVATPISLADGNARPPDIVSDANGHALAVWSQREVQLALVGDNRVYAARYVPGDEWSSPVSISSDVSHTPDFVHAAIDPNGNALVVWSQSDGTRANLWANHYSAGLDWEGAGIMDSQDSPISVPQVAIDANGNGLALWTQAKNGVSSIWASRFIPGITTGAIGTWSPPEPIEDDDARPADNPQIAFDANGNALAVWQQGGGSDTDILWNRYTPTGQWGTADFVETDEAGEAVVPRVAFDANGNALAAWLQSNGDHRNVRASRFTSANLAWGQTAFVETGTVSPELPLGLAIGLGGEAFAVWVQPEGARTDIKFNRFE